MAKYKSSKPGKSLFKISNLLKKSPLAALILVLSWVLTQLIDPLHSSQSIKLPASNEPVQLYSNQTNDDLTALFEQAIMGAEHSITLFIYALTDRHLLQALQKKSEQGVALWIVCDAKASPGVSKKLPLATCIRRVGTGLMHHKILVIDDQQILLGSANFTYSSLTTHGNLVMGIENQGLAHALVERAKLMDEDGNILPPMVNEILAADQNVELWMLPNEEPAVNRVIELIRSAKKTIQVAMFTWTRNDFAKELITAAKRGVKVEVVLDRYSGKGASAKVAQLLFDGKIPLSFSTGQALLHHKFAYIDDSILINGSANWTAAFKNNDDYFVVVNPVNVEQQEKMALLWTNIKKKSQQIQTSTQLGSL